MSVVVNELAAARRRGVPIFALFATPPRDKVRRTFPGGHGMWGLYGLEARDEIIAWLDRYLGRVR